MNAMKQRTHPKLWTSMIKELDKPGRMTWRTWSRLVTETPRALATETAAAEARVRTEKRMREENEKLRTKQVLIWSERQIAQRQEEEMAAAAKRTE